MNGASLVQGLLQSTEHEARIGHPRHLAHAMDLEVLVKTRLALYATRCD